VRTSVKRKAEVLNDDDDDAGEAETERPCEPPHETNKLRRMESTQPLLGKGARPPVWINCHLALERHERVPCRIIAKVERFVWLVELKVPAELQLPKEANAPYRKGSKWMVQWLGEVSDPDTLPIVKPLWSYSQPPS